MLSAPASSLLWFNRKRSAASRRLALRLAETRSDAFLHVGLQNAECLLVTLDCQVQSVKHPLGREEVGDDSLRDGDRLGRNPKRLRIQTEINDQFLRGAGHAAEIGIQGQGLRIVNFDLGALLLGRGSRDWNFGLGIRHDILLIIHATWTK